MSNDPGLVRLWYLIESERNLVISTLIEDGNSSLEYAALE